MGNQSTVKIWDLFGGSNEAHGRYTVQRTTARGKAEGKAVTEAGPATQAIWNAHLAGTGPGVGVIPIRTDGTVLWGCIDVDEIGIDHAALEKDIDDLKLPLVVSRSKSGGAHAFLFLKEPAPAGMIQNYLAQCSSALGYGGCEIFPKQTERKEGDVGNWLNMPYFFADKTNRYATHNGELLDLQGFVDFAVSRRVLADELVPPRQFNPPPVGEGFQLPEIIAESSGPYKDSEGKDYYGRNQVLYHFGCSLRSKGADDATVASRLSEVNANRCQPPLEPRKLNVIIRQVQKLPVGEPAQAKKEKVPKLPPLAPAVWPAATSIPRLDRLYGSHYVRGFVSVTAGPGGIGKSSLSQAEVVMMLAHIGMVEGILSPRPLNVLYINLEDDLDQIWRHFLATASHYGIDPKELEGKLFVHSGQDQPIKIAELKRHDVRVWNELVDELIQFALANNIDVVIFDPFVSLHNVNENDNGQIDAVMKELGRLASKGKCAVDVIHHSRKTNGEGQSVETIRGARSLTDAARMARVIDTMTETEAENFGLLGFDANGREKPSYRRYIFERPAKQNLAPPADKRRWYLLVSVPVGNAGKEQDLEPSDWVGVPTSWTPPEGEPLFDDDKLPDLLKLFENSDQRVSEKANDWAGYAIGELLDYDMGRGLKSADVLARHKSARKRAQQVIDDLQQRGLIIEEDRKDSNREPRPTWILTSREIPF